MFELRMKNAVAKIVQRSKDPKKLVEKYKLLLESGFEGKVVYLKEVSKSES